MTISLDQQKRADAAVPEGSSQELAKLVCKLRWIGMEDEAERLLTQLDQRRKAADTDSVFATSEETD